MLCAPCAKKIKVVQKDSAILRIAKESIIPLQANHRDMCRLPNDADKGCFATVCNDISRLVGLTSKNGKFVLNKKSVENR